MARHKLVEGLYDLIVSEELDDALETARDDGWLLELQQAGDDVLPSMERARLLGRQSRDPPEVLDDVRPVLGGPGVRTVRVRTRRTAAVGSAERAETEGGAALRRRHSRLPTAAPATHARRVAGGARCGASEEPGGRGDGDGQDAALGVRLQAARRTSRETSFAAIRGAPKGDPRTESDGVSDRDARRRVRRVAGRQLRTRGGRACVRFGPVATRRPARNDRPGCLRRRCGGRVSPRRGGHLRSSPRARRASLLDRAHGNPERADGLDVKHYFDGRVAAELRLWDALDQNLLSPFQYFGITDTADLSSVKFSRRGYDRRELEGVITGDQFRAKRVLQAVEDYVEDPSAMKALGFCVSIEHAEMMAEEFCEDGLPSAAISSRSSRKKRQNAKSLLSRGELVCLFVVDLFNEGVDIPDVDTVLFLRPTESGTVFLQQLGRGLRLSEGKDCLVVLDFVGNAHKRFRYDIKYRALLGGTRRTVLDAVEQGFPHLPPGCSIQLERRAQEYVLDNIRKSLPSNVTGRARELEEIAAVHGADVTLGQYMDAAALSLDDVYARAGHSWTDLRRRAGLRWPDPGDDAEDTWLRGMSRATHIDDLDRLRSWRNLLASDGPPTGLSHADANARRLRMLLGVLRWDFNDLSQIDAYFESLWCNTAVRHELLQLLDVLEDGLRHTSKKLEVDGLEDVPLRVHARYSRDEVMIALNQFRDGRLFQPREGVVWASDIATDIFFVTLQKTEDEYSPETLYRDYPISERLFHWESQHTTSEESATGRRYVQHRQQGINVLLFVRQHKKVNGITQPYVFLGPADYVRHESDRPMQIVWALRQPMPAWFYQEAKMAAG